MARIRSSRGGRREIDEKASPLGYELSLSAKELRADVDDIAGADVRNGWVYDPPANARVPKAGAWALIRKELPPMERDLHMQVRVGRVFYVEHQGNADEAGFTPDGRYKVVCRSPFGDVHLFPYEYAVMEPVRLTELWQAGEFTFHPTGVSEKQFSDVLFYALSRGIARADATVMALGTMSGPVGWFEPATQEGYALLEALANMGGPLTEVNHERRRQAHARRMA